MQFVIAEIHELACRTAAGDGVDLADRELSLCKRLQHFLADRTGGANDRNIKSLFHSCAMTA